MVLTGDQPEVWLGHQIHLPGGSVTLLARWYWLPWVVGCSISHGPLLGAACVHTHGGWFTQVRNPVYWCGSCSVLYNPALKSRHSVYHHQNSLELLWEDTIHGSEGQVARILEALLGACSHKWRKSVSTFFSLESATRQKWLSLPFLSHITL
jgi:hypothetical protein